MSIDTADMAVFFSDFAVMVAAPTWGTSFPAIFDYEFVEFANHSGVKPVALMQTANIKTGYSTGDLFVIDGESYQLVDVQYAEPGLTRLVFSDA